MPAASQTITLTQNVALTVFWTPWYDDIVIENTSGTNTFDIYARADGIAAVGSAAGELLIQPTQTLIISNDLPRHDPISFLPGFETEGNETLAILYTGLIDTT